MATLYDQCDAIYADTTLSPAEQYAQAAAVKASGIVTLATSANVIGKAYSTTINGHTLTVTLAALVADGVHLRITLGDVYVDGVKAKVDHSVTITNPPCLTVDPKGTISRNGRLCSYNPVALIQSILGNDVAKQLGLL